jgi:hypothetical protein
MKAKLTRLTHKIAIQPHLVSESSNICSSRSRRTVWKLLCVQNNEVYILQRVPVFENERVRVKRHNYVITSPLGAFRAGVPKIQL